jgi:hypothetical protein
MRRMSGSRGSLWLWWALFVAALALQLVLAEGVASLRAQPWHTARTAVAGFVLALISVALGVWTFALREGLALRDVRSGALDPSTPVGLFRLRQMLVALWILCLVIGLLGSVVAWGAASARLAWPYIAGAGVLLLLHAPRRWVFGSAAGAAESA